MLLREDRGSVEFDGQILSVLAEELVVVVVDGPERRKVARVHGGEEVLPPATLQVHQAPQALLSVSVHHLQTVRHVRLVEDPSEERGAVRGQEKERPNKLIQLCTHESYRTLL